MVWGNLLKFRRKIFFNFFDRKKDEKKKNKKNKKNKNKKNKKKSIPLFRPITKAKISHLCICIKNTTNWNHCIGAVRWLWLWCGLGDAIIIVLNSPLVWGEHFLFVFSSVFFVVVVVSFLYVKSTNYFLIYPLPPPPTNGFYLILVLWAAVN